MHFNELTWQMSLAVALVALVTQLVENPPAMRETWV